MSWEQFATEIGAQSIPGPFNWNGSEETRGVGSSSVEEALAFVSLVLDCANDQSRDEDFAPLEMDEGLPLAIDSHIEAAAASAGSWIFESYVHVVEVLSLKNVIEQLIGSEVLVNDWRENHSPLESFVGDDFALLRLAGD